MRETRRPSACDLKSMAESDGVKPHAIMVEFLFQGHITPFFHLAVALASKGCTVTYIQTELNHHLMWKASTQQPDSVFSGSGLDIRCTTISDGFPLDFDRDLNFHEFFESILRDFPGRVDGLVGKIVADGGGGPERHFLVADTSYLWPPAVAAKHRIPNVSFWTSQAVHLSIGHHLELLKHNGVLTSYHDYKDELRDIPGVKPNNVRDHMAYALTEDDPNVPQILKEAVMKAYLELHKADFVLCNTVQELEPDAISGLNRKLPTYAIGPTNFFPTNLSITPTLRSPTDCAQWLDTKPPGSVLLASFGSLVQTDKEVILEIAHGLRMSGVDFLWVLRPDAAAGGINGDQLLLPESDRGLIVPWCNQRDVLSHQAIGGFLTHCGWNSLLESMWYGVPLICYPVFMDQPVNRNLVVEDWKIGTNLCDKPPLSRVEVAEKVSSIMNSIGSMRMEMKKLSKIVHSAVGINGSSDRSLDKFIKDLKEKMMSMTGGGK